MLDLSDPRWSSFETTYNCNRVPLLLAEWHAAIGFDQELSRYRELGDQFMHQCTITDLAYAIVPYLVAACESGSTKFANIYLTDVGVIEANRLTPDYRPPKMPAFLADVYGQAIVRSQPLVEDLIDSISDPDEKWELRAIKPALFGNAELAWQQWINGFGDDQ